MNAFQFFVKNVRLLAKNQNVKLMLFKWKVVIWHGCNRKKKQDTKIYWIESKRTYAFERYEFLSKDWFHKFRRALQKFAEIQNDREELYFYWKEEDVCPSIIFISLSWYFKRFMEDENLEFKKIIIIACRDKYI